MEFQLFDSNGSIARSADIPFSNDRMIVSNFLHGKNLLNGMIKTLIQGKFGGLFTPQLKTVVQCMEVYEDGLSEVEKIALKNIAELSGSRLTLVIESDKPLTNSQLEALFKTF